MKNNFGKYAQDTITTSAIKIHDFVFYKWSTKIHDVPASTNSFKVHQKLRKS